MTWRRTRSRASPPSCTIRSTPWAAGSTTSGRTSTTAASSSCSPAANFTTSLSGRTLTVSDASTGGLAGGSWAWDFGDGAKSTARNPPKHTYASDGTYRVTLTVTAPGGTSTSTQDVKVYTTTPPP